MGLGSKVWKHGCVWLRMGDEENWVDWIDETEEVGESIVDANFENPSIDVSTGEDASSVDERRNRAPLVWMKDYETGEGLFEDDSEAYLVMSGDPV